jgi:precorrin-2 dehydrogenase/sirohydrochlorin ferrochelatase
MRYYPVNLDVQGSTVIIIGGGTVAVRKCARLVDAGARVVIIAPELDQRLQKMAEDGHVSLQPRDYHPGDLVGASLVFAATDDEKLNLEVAQAGKALGIPVNVTSAPEAGTFTSPAVVTRGDLLLTVSTGGRCPPFAGKLCRELSSKFGTEYAAVVELLGAVREKLLTEKGSNAYNKGLLNTLAEQNLPFLLKHQAFAEIDRILLNLFGSGYSLAELGVRKKDPE